jgi:hypothetical protein
MFGHGRRLLIETMRVMRSCFWSHRMGALCSRASLTMGAGNVRCAELSVASAKEYKAPSLQVRSLPAARAGHPAGLVPPVGLPHGRHYS